LPARKLRRHQLYKANEVKQDCTMRRIKLNRKDSLKQDEIVTDSVGYGLAIGVAMGAGVGTIIGMLLDNLALGMTTGTSLGICIGIAIGYAVAEKKKSQLQLKPVFAKRRPFNNSKR
jgi:F0F1-type ATP synthase assembly protein I